MLSPSFSFACAKLLLDNIKQVNNNEIKLREIHKLVDKGIFLIDIKSQVYFIINEQLYTFIWEMDVGNIDNIALDSK